MVLQRAGPGMLPGPEENWVCRHLKGSCCKSKTVPVPLYTVGYTYTQWWASLHDVVTALQMSRYFLRLKR
jgi:hypothetical protein